MEYFGCEAALKQLSFLTTKDCCSSCHNEPDEYYPQCTAEYKDDTFEVCCGLKQAIDNHEAH